MRTIRVNIWETNSSSSHSISLGNPENIIIDQIVNEFEGDKDEESLELQEEFNNYHILQLNNVEFYDGYGESERDYLIVVAKSLISKLFILYGMIIANIDTYDKPVDKMLQEPRVQLFFNLCKKYLSDITNLQFKLQPTIGNPFYYEGKWTTKYYYSTIGSSLLDKKTDAEIEEYFKKVLDEEAVVMMDSPYGGLKQWTHVIIKII